VVSVTVRALMQTCSADGCGVFGSGAAPRCSACSCPCDSGPGRGSIL